MIYLDYNATTPIDPHVAQAMMPFLTREFGNPSSDYEPGQRAKAALEKARAQIATLIHATPEEILWTSGGTESNNTVLKGLFFRSEKPFHMITSRIEHPAIINPALFLMTLGADVTFLHTGISGRVDPEDVRKAIRPETRLISIMLANNETGVIQPVEEVGRLARARGIAFHTDAAQALGKIPVDVSALGVDFLSVAGHKLYAPKGVGALFVRKGLELEPLLHGAGQETGRRAGTENVLLAVGLGSAAELVQRDLPETSERLTRLRDRLAETLTQGIPGLVPVGGLEPRLPNTLNVCIPGIWGGDVLKETPEVLASTGSACHAGSVKLSPVLAAMGLDPEVAKGALRLSLGRWTTEEEVDRAAAALIGASRTVRDRG